jgi:hypothetical protein
MDRLKWKSKNSIPHYGELRGAYSWIPDFLKVEAMYAEIADKKAEIEATKAAPRALSDAKKALVASLNRLREQQAQALGAFILNYSRHPDPAEQLRFELPDSLLRINTNFSNEMLDAVFEELKTVWPAGAITDATRKKRKADLQAEITELEAQIAEHPDFEKWKTFVDYWRQLCGKVAVGIDPQGFELSENLRPGEVKAFAELELSKYLNPDSKTLPADPN